MPVSPSSLIAAVDVEQLGETDADSSARLELLDRFALICDPRSRRGRRHSLASVLGVVACAMVAVGSDSLTAIEQWADNASQQVLADLDVWRDPLTGRHQPPSDVPRISRKRRQASLPGGPEQRFDPDRPQTRSARTSYVDEAWTLDRPQPRPAPDHRHTLVRGMRRDGPIQPPAASPRATFRRSLASDLRTRAAIRL